MAKVGYKISARATILLGREGVSKADGALVELIKNTYDADADICFLCFDKEKDTIYLFDNGIGMDWKTITDCWMLIGTDNKRENYQSSKHRIKSGEKGIGRFALDRLGASCTMYTKTASSEDVLCWKTNWSDFENTNKTLDEMQAELDVVEEAFQEIIPDFLRTNINHATEEIYKQNHVLIEPYKSGTIFMINGLRDNWEPAFLNKFISGLGTLLPPVEQNNYFLCTMKSHEDKYRFVENPFTDEYDYKLQVHFDGNCFSIKMDRNEFDLNRIPKEVFEMEAFKKYPFRKEDFENQIFTKEVSIQELLRTEDEDIIRKVHQLGEFSFEYVFMKLTNTDDSNEVFYYKEIGKNRKEWLQTYGGIKIYRDNFFVRPYGDPYADAFDWLGLDARKAKNPASISHLSGGWHVRNRQGQGTVFISRISNEVLLDKSSREGIIENEYFAIFKNVLVSLLSFFERDRAFIGRTMKEYYDEVNRKAKAKEEAQDIASKVLKNASSKKKNTGETNEEKLAKAVQVYEEERNDLLSEIQQLKVLATSGLLTSTVAHDLKTLNAMLITRVKTLRNVIEKKDESLIDRHLSDLMLNDQFLKSWLTIVATQARKDRRSRKKENVYKTIRSLVDVLRPILERKQVNVTVEDDGQVVERRIFSADYESIFYNLIINSIEAFQRASIDQRKINISMSADDDNIYIQYKDNGPGLADIFSEPYDIFVYGTTSKKDKEGNDIGTGMGMYIVASTLREYSAKYTITECHDGFGLQIIIPRSR